MKILHQALVGIRLDGDSAFPGLASCRKCYGLRLMKKLSSGCLMSLCLLAGASCGDNLPALLEVSGVVFEDKNQNGVFDEGEGISGWSVYLDDQEGQVLEVKTNTNGEYLFENISSGRYVLSQEMQRGWRSAPQDLPLLVAPSDPSSESGHKSTIDKNERAHIIGGSESEQAAYPFMVSIGDRFDTQFFHFCGGVLISDQYILTAAHCSTDVVVDEVGATLGTNDPDTEGTVVSVSKVIVHPKWEEDTVLGYDMALWKLSERVDLEALNLNTVAMLRPNNSALAQPDILASVLGWGVSDLESSRLQEAHLPIATNAMCGASYPQVPSFDTQICAGLPEGGLDSCQGDSGGPLLVRDEEQSRWIHAGITSWGQGCAVAGFFGIYGRTSALSQWAYEKIQEQSTRSYGVELSRNNISADFANSRTTRELFGEINTRWGMAALVPTGLINGSVEEFVGFSLSFTLLEDSAKPETEFECSLDRDSDGPMAEVDFDCQAGVNQVDIAGYSPGTVTPRIVVRAGGRTKSRGLEVTVRPVRPVL